MIGTMRLCSRQDSSLESSEALLGRAISRRKSGRKSPGRRQPSDGKRQNSVVWEYFWE